MHQIVISSARKRPCIIGPSEREVFLPFGSKTNLLNIVGRGRDEVSERAFLLRFSLIKSSSSKLGRWSA